MNALLKKLSRWVNVIQWALFALIFVEGFLVIIIGIASNNYTLTETLWPEILIACSIAYLLIVLLKAGYQLAFPGSIVEELIAKKELEEKNKLFARQRAINGFIQTAIQGLNEQTCSFDQKPKTPEQLCDEQLEVRLKALLEPIISYTDVILDTSTEKKFTIGLYLSYYSKFPDKNDYTGLEIEEQFGYTYLKDSDPVIDEGIITLKDELNLSEIVFKDLMITDNLTGAWYEIQSAIKRTKNNMKFGNTEFEHDEKRYTILTSEMFEVCSNDYATGVLFIISKDGIEFPVDVSEVLSIFNRITANYVSKYSTCIREQVIDKVKKDQEAKKKEELVKPQANV